jgi:hypothetical protein
MKPIGQGLRLELVEVEYSGLMTLLQAGDINAAISSFPKPVKL